MAKQSKSATDVNPIGAGTPAPDSVENAILNAVQADTHKGVLAAMFESESIRAASNTTYDSVLYAAEIVERDKVDISDAMAFMKELYAKHGMVELNYAITEDGVVTFELGKPAPEPPATEETFPKLKEVKELATMYGELLNRMNDTGLMEAFNLLLQRVAYDRHVVVPRYEAILIEVEPRGTDENLHYHKVGIVGSFYGRFNTVTELEQNLLVNYLTAAGKDNLGRTLYQVEVTCIDDLESLGFKVSVDALYLVEVVPTYYL